jgi:hypothetical protein
LPGIRSNSFNLVTNESVEIKSDSIGLAEIIIYDFETNQYRKHLKKHFDNQRIYTNSQGLCEFLSNGDVFVESQNQGTIFILNNDEIVLKKVLLTDMENHIELPNWFRIYENIDFIK